MDMPTEEIAQASLPDELAWGVNPWKRQGVPFKRSPQLALIIIVVISLVFGYALNVPNYPADLISNLEKELAAAPADTPPEQLEKAQQQLTAIKRHVEIWPLKMISWAGISMLLLFGMTATIFLPVRYKLDSKGVTVHFVGTPSFRAWEHYRNFYVHDTGVHLTTIPKPSAFDPFRGHYLQVVDNKVDVVEFIKRYMVLRGQPEAR